MFHKTYKLQSDENYSVDDFMDLVNRLRNLEADKLVGISVARSADAKFFIFMSSGVSDTVVRGKAFPNFLNFHTYDTEDREYMHHIALRIDSDVLVLNNPTHLPSLNTIAPGSYNLSPVKDLKTLNYEIIYMGVGLEEIRDCISDTGSKFQPYLERLPSYEEFKREREKGQEVKSVETIFRFIRAKDEQIKV